MSATRRAPLILCYHNVIPDDVFDGAIHLGVSHRASTFEQHVSIVSRLFNITTDIENARPGECVFTFDDGYKNNLIAASILSKYNVHGVFFLCASSLYSKAPVPVDNLLKWCSYLPEGSYRPYEELGQLDITDASSRISSFNLLHRFLMKSVIDAVEYTSALDKVYEFSRLSISRELDFLRFSPLGEDDIGQMKAAEHKIGCHSWDHRILSLLNDTELDEEFARCTEFLQRHCNISVFSYPFGGTSEVDARVASAAMGRGYTAAVVNVPKWPHRINGLEKYFIGRVSIEETLPWPRRFARLVGFDEAFVSVAKKFGVKKRA